MIKEAEILVTALKKKGLKFTTAESCTGGLISGAITDVAGASAVFDGGVCAYANRIKTALLGVPEKTLGTVGAVSAATAAAMARGARTLTGADIAVSVTGIAGPDGGTAEKPVGTVYIAAATAEGVLVRRYNFSGDRATIRAKTVSAALRLALMCV